MAGVRDEERSCSLSVSHITSPPYACLDMCAKQLTANQGPWKAGGAIWE